MAQRHMPLGYCMVDGVIAVNEPQGEIVRMVFEQYLAGQSLLGIAKQLTETGVLNGNGKPSWSHCSVGHILNNAKYRGKDDYPALVPAEWLEQAAVRRKQQNKRLNRNINSFANAQNSKYVFSGKLRCGACGAMFKRYTERSKAGKKANWKCKHYLKDNRVFCRSGAVTDEQIEAAFVRVVQNLLEQPEVAEQPCQKKDAQTVNSGCMEAALGDAGGFLEQPSTGSKILPEELLRITEEIAEGLRQAHVDVPTVQRLLYEQAVLAYQEAEIRDGEHQTEKLRAALAGCSVPVVFQAVQFRRMVHYVTVYPEGRLRFTLINGAYREESIRNQLSKEEHGCRR